MIPVFIALALALLGTGCRDTERPETARSRAESEPAGAKIRIDRESRTEERPALYVDPPPPPLPNAWTVHRPFPKDLRAVIRTQPVMSGFPSETVLEANSESGRVTYEYDVDRALESGVCSFTIGATEIAAFGWPKFMALVEQRRRLGPPPRPVDDDPFPHPVAVVDPAFLVHASLRAFRQTATEDVIARNGLQADLIDRIHAAAPGIAHWSSYTMHERLGQLWAAINRCAPRELYVRAEISAVDGRARALTIKGEPFSDAVRDCVVSVLSEARFPVPAARSCNLDWRMNAVDTLLPNPYRR